MSDYESDATPDPEADMMAISHCAFTLLSMWDQAMRGDPMVSDEAFKRLGLAACFAGAAYDKHPQRDAAPSALIRSFLVALTNPGDPQLDYLRASAKEATQ